MMRKSDGNGIPSSGKRASMIRLYIVQTEKKCFRVILNFVNEGYLWVLREYKTKISAKRYLLRAKRRLSSPEIEFYPLEKK